jgi:transposase
MDKQQLIHWLIRRGRSDRSINRETGVHRKTIADYRKQLQTVPEVPSDSPGRPAQTVPIVPPDFFGQANQTVPIMPPDPPALPWSKSVRIVPFRERIQEKLELGLTARRIYQDLVEEAQYQGGYDSVRRYAHKLKKKLPRHFDRLPTKPGWEAQVDFGLGAPVLRDGKYRRPWLFKMTLSFSGYSYEEQVWKQDMETFIRCHEHAFQAFGGVPERIKLDNIKSGVLRACLYEPILNPVYRAFAEHAGFIPDPCMPRKPEHKGRVERDIRYTKDNALKGRRFESLEASNAFLRHWNERWARTRIHGSKKAQVWKLFTECERVALQPLPASTFAYFKIALRKVDVTGHIEVDKNFYSVPHPYIGQQLIVHYSQQYIKVYQAEQLVVSHRPRSGVGGCTTLPGHKPGYKPISQEQAEWWLCSKAKIVGPQCYQLVTALLTQNADPLAIRKSRGILALAQKYPTTIEQACRQAIACQGHHYRLVKKWCENGVPAASGPRSLTQEHELIRSAYEYQTLIQERSLPHGTTATDPQEPAFGCDGACAPGTVSGG